MEVPCVGDVKAVHGKFLGPETALDKSRTTSAYIEFENVDAANMAFKALRGASGTDALGRPQKAVKMALSGAVAAAAEAARSQKSTRVAASTKGVKDGGDRDSDPDTQNRGPGPDPAAITAMAAS